MKCFAVDLKAQSYLCESSEWIALPVVYCLCTLFTRLKICCVSFEFGAHLWQLNIKTSCVDSMIVGTGFIEETSSVANKRQIEGGFVVTVGIFALSKCCLSSPLMLYHVSVRP